MSAGVLSQISFKKETTWGTAVVPDKSIAVRPTGGIAVKNNVQLLPAIKGQVQKYYDAIKGKVSYEGELTIDAFGDYLGYFLLSAFGTDTPALHSGETIVYDHVFSEGTSKPSLTIEQSIGENTRRYTGTICNSLKITGKVGEMIEVAAGVKAKSQASATEVTGAFSTVPAFNFAQAQIKIGGTVIAEVENFELQYKNGVEMVYALGSTDPSYNAIQGGSEAHVKMDMFLDATALTRFTNYLANTKEAMEIILTGGSIGTAASYMLDILIPRANYTAAETKITDQHNLLTVEAEGIYDTATSQLIKATLTNLLASY